MPKENQEKENKTTEVLKALDYLLAEGFLCLTNQKTPTIALSQEANI